MTRAGTVLVEMGDVKLARAGEQLLVFLGSCVSIILWHPAKHVAVMSHILLPFQPLTSKDANQALFASGAWRLMQAQLVAEDIALADCICHVVGAAQFVDGMESGLGRIILQEVLALIHGNDIVVSSSHVGGSGYRVLSFDAASGCLHSQQHAAAPACSDITYGTFTRPLHTPSYAEIGRNPDGCGLGGDRCDNPADFFSSRPAAS